MSKTNSENGLDIKPIYSSTMADRVEERLRQYFREQRLEPGDAVPKEMELAEALGVSRNVVREALSRFRMLGLIESRKRRGMIMAQPDVLGAFERVLDPRMLDEATIQELFELRLVIEMGITDLLFIRRTEADLQALRDIMQKESRAANEQERVRCDIEFHATLYRIAGNKLIKRFQKMLRPFFDYSFARERTPRGKVTKNKITHLDLIATLATGTPDQYRAQMKEHLRDKFRLLTLSDDTESFEST